MALERGITLTPNKKPFLIQEVQEELSKVNQEIKEKGIVGGSVDSLKESKSRLESILSDLTNMKGVVTASKGDDVLDAIDEAKKNRLQTEFYLGLRKSTIYLITFIAVGYGIYYFYKKGLK
jgi:hypothetical protein